jgi:hypothetical protein
MGIAVRRSRLRCDLEHRAKTISAAFACRAITIPHGVEDHTGGGINAVGAIILENVD